jgi:hypothetical protein
MASHGGLLEPMDALRRIVIAGLALGLCTAAYQERADRIAAARNDDYQAWQRARDADAPSRRICAVDRLAESRLPRTTCRTAREWRERQLHDLRRQ